ncbi:hypothetical protein HPB48_017380 [Haemaphysalis longicornis]|uniref:Uncharacterized protein n=1 Tax=Haemaphysalis longicornis TaxID=44386 RepID=A0A9J6GLX5_HAELO|nr:hypothetical protein HPB48_017380 [Haemaphysalis longicornis]
MYKVKGYALRDGLNPHLKPHHLAQGIALACNNHPTCAENRLLLRTNHTQNAAVISTPHAETADILRKLSHINLAGKDNAVFAYVAASDNSVKGVIHGILPGTQPSELQAHLPARNHSILYTRVLGQTQTAVITFEGTRVLQYVYHYGAEIRCLPYRLTRQVSSICLRVGYRADVRPNPETNRCPQCGQASPRVDNDCKPGCALCQGDHPTLEETCPARLRKHTRRQGATHDGNEELPAGILWRSRS